MSGKHQARCDAVVGYAWCRSSYVAIRSLARLGLRVAAIDSTGLGMGQCSRYCAERFKHADPILCPDQFIDDLKSILELTQARFYLPGADEGELVVANRHRLPGRVVLPLHELGPTAIANDKLESCRLAAQLGVPTPALVEWRDLAQLKLALEALEKPVVVKLRRGCGAKGVFYADSPSQALQTVNTLVSQFQLPPERMPVVQERVEGEGWGVACLYWHGSHVASFIHRRLREKTLTGGTSTLRASAHNPLLLKWAHRILDRLDWHGLAMVEFKWDPASRRGWFIEINPRLWGSIALPVHCGVDFPALTYLAATGGPEKARASCGDYRDGVIARWYLGDVILAVKHLRHGRLLRALRDLVPGGADVYDDLLLDDPAATAAEFATYLYRFLKERNTNPTDRGILG